MVSGAALQNLITISTALASSELETNGSVNHVRTYTEIRSEYMKKSLYSISQNASTIGDRGTSKVYVKGTCSLIPYTKCLLKMMKVPIFFFFSLFFLVGWLVGWERHKYV